MANGTNWMLKASEKAGRSDALPDAAQDIFDLVASKCGFLTVAENLQCIKKLPRILKRPAEPASYGSSIHESEFPVACVNERDR